MSFSHWLSAALLALPLAAAAQQKQPDPGDANSVVPAPVYDSAFENFQAVADENQSPDKSWRAANDEMQRLGGHAGHLRGSETRNRPSSSTDDAHQGHHGKGK